MAITLKEWMDSDTMNSYNDNRIIKNDWSDLIKLMKDSYTIDMLEKRVLNTWENDWTDEKIEDKFKHILGKESEEDKVARILKGDFEKQFGITFEKFIEVYNYIVENNPEKLI